MRVEQLETTITEMSASERQRLVHWLDEHRHELMPESESDQQREVLARLAELDNDPAALEPFEEADLERMIHEAVYARTQKASVGRH
jgi:hypothetical protein